MSQLYEIYEKNTFELARTVVIKFDMVCDMINIDLQDKGYFVNADDKYSQKYYMNLSGRYHKYDHDLLRYKYGQDHIMVTIATDKGYKETPLKKELFHGPGANRSLLNEYQINSAYYNRLVRKYPEFETLIKGILNPIDLDLAVQANDGAILSIAYTQIRAEENRSIYYEVPDTVKGTKVAALIEDQEYNLIYDLQKYIDGVLFRWVVKDYILLDDMYVPSILGVIYANLPCKIMNIRLKNKHTPAAHSFHIYNYLQGHGLLGKYIKNIPHDQVLYLYRNVRYLELNFGKTFTFDQLIENLLTPSKVPLAGYYLRHELSDMNNDNLQPQPYLHREHINFKTLGASDDTRDIIEILTKQIPLARDNHKYLPQVERQTQRQMRFSDDDKLITKVLDSEMIKHSDPLPVEFTSMLVWYWVYLSSRGFYTGSIFVTNPVTEDRIAVTPLNAFILYLYCINFAVKKEPMKIIPTDIAIGRWIKKSLHTKFVPDHPAFKTRQTPKEFLKQVDVKRIKESKVSAIVGSMEDNYIAYDSLSFFSLVEQHYYEMRRQYFEVCKIEDIRGQGYGEFVFKQTFWHDIPIHLTEERGVEYSNWLPKLGINFKYFNPNDYHDLALSLLESATGMQSQGQLNRRLLQSSMLDILKHFTSYTTHVISSVNDSAVTNLQGKYLRISDIKTEGSGVVTLKFDLSLGLKHAGGYANLSVPLSTQDNWQRIHNPYYEGTLGQHNPKNDRPYIEVKARAGMENPSLTLIPSKS